MKKLLACISASIGPDNLCKSCSRDGCRVYLEGLPDERIIVDVDKAFAAHGRQGRHCDFVVFMLEDGRKLLAVPIELKSGRVDVSQAVEQLQAGAKFAEEFLPKRSEVGCRLVLFHGCGMNRIDRSRLNRKKIRFRGMDLTVKTMRCCSPENLAKALKP